MLRKSQFNAPLQVLDVTLTTEHNLASLVLAIQAMVHVHVSILSFLVLAFSHIKFPMNFGPVLFFKQCKLGPLSYTSFWRRRFNLETASCRNWMFSFANGIHLLLSSVCKPIALCVY